MSRVVVFRTCVWKETAFVCVFLFSFLWLIAHKKQIGFFFPVSKPIRNPTFYLNQTSIQTCTPYNSTHTDDMNGGDITVTLMNCTWDNTSVINYDVWWLPQWCNLASVCETAQSCETWTVRFV